MQKHPAPCQLQSIYGGQSSMESSLTLSLWIQPSGPEIRAQVAGCPTAQLSASCPAPVKAEPAPNQSAMTQTHSSLSAQQQAGKCADMGNIPLDMSGARD